MKPITVQVVALFRSPFPASSARHVVRVVRPVHALLFAAVFFGGCQSSIGPVDPKADLIEFQSVWQYCKAYSIYQDSAVYDGRIPEDPFAFPVPAAIFKAIGDTLKGSSYTRYIDPHLFPSIRAAGPSSAVPRSGGRTVYLDTLTASTLLLTDSTFESETYDDFLLCNSEVSLFPNVVVNLRNNLGGRLDVLDSIIAAMVPAGTAYIQARERDYDDGAKKWVTIGWRDWTTATGSGLAYKEKRFVVLMNGLTASASEILAAALYEGGRGPGPGGRVPLIGAKSYGKGIGQIKLVRRTRRMIQITTLQLRGVSPRIGNYHWNGKSGGIEPDPVPESMMEQAAACSTEWERQLFYAVKMLEPSVTPDDITYPPERNPGFESLPKSGCYKTVSEDELDARRGLSRGD